MTEARSGIKLDARTHTIVSAGVAGSQLPLGKQSGGQTVEQQRQPLQF